jgi:molybdenum cofactor cytidylyltransferase
MNLSQSLRLSSTPRLAFVGAGGKTTALFRLAREYHSPVLVTTTTHLSQEQVRLGDQHYTITSPEQIARLQPHDIQGVCVFTGPPDGSGRLTGLPGPIMENLLRLADALSVPLLIEADGSRQLPVKAPASHEPVIPTFVDTVVVVAGLSALGKPLSSQVVHRPEEFARLSGLSSGEPIDPAALRRVLVHADGGLKGIPPGARRILLLNQADTDALQSQAHAMLLQRLGQPGLFPAYQAVLIASLIQEQIFAVHDPVAGILLAAGGASRFGAPKQLLSYQGMPLVRRVAQVALASGVSPVIVVSGAYTPEISQALADLKVVLLHNPDWQAGQSTSVKVGVNALPSEAGSVIFFLADQPFVDESLVRALVEAHAQSLAPIVAPLVDGRRSNPVLFDRQTWGDFLSLTGDLGGRALFSRYPATWVPWHDPRLLLDIDTPEDYQRLIGQQSGEGDQPSSVEEPDY